MTIGRSELARSRNSERVAIEFDLRASAGFVIEIEQEIAHGAMLDRFDQRRDRLAIAN